jgi:hypothetical protein
LFNSLRFMEEIIIGNCYWCGCALYKENKPEHIIKKSFGGAITSNRILCDAHNNLLGSSIDKRISDELEFLYDS